MRVEGIENVRRILCVFPRYTSSFGTFEYAYPLTDGVQAFMPPQGLLLIAAYLPANWPVRFIDENIRPASKEDFEWAEAVFVSGMHIQRQQMNDICRRAHAFDLAVAIGGPSVSACPDYYPSFDYLHVGELGDATDELIERLARDPSRPDRQVVLKTADRLDMTKFPIPAYELAEIKKYFLGSIQYSSGCPYQCEFCDIPGLYGRNPRLKTPQQIVAELDRLRECGVTGSVYFVDDSRIPLLTINLLQALPKTPLWDRLERENRLIDDDTRDSNVDFRLPYDQVVSAWRKCMEVAYQPEKLYARYQYQVDYTYANRLKVPVTAEQKSWANVKRGLIMLRNIFWKVGVLGDYRREFWKFALSRLRHGEIEALLSVAMIGHHLIMFARAASVGQQNASNYSIRLREASVPAE